MQLVVDLSAFPDLAESLGSVEVGSEVSGAARFLLNDRDENGETVTLDLISFEPEVPGDLPPVEVPPVEEAPAPVDNAVTRLFG